MKLFLTAIPILLFATQVDAQKKKPNYDGLSDSARVQLQSFRSYMNDCKPDALIPKNDMTKCERVLRNQRKRLDRIKGADRKHATFLEFSRYQERVEKVYAESLAAHKAAKEAQNKLRQTAWAMKKDLGKRSPDLWFLKDSREGKRLGENNVSPSTAKKRLETVATLGDLAAKCAGEYAPVLADKRLSSMASADRTPKPAVACELATDWKALAAAWIPKAAASWAEAKRKQYQGFVADIEKSGRTSDDILELLTVESMKTRVAENLASYREVAAIGGVEIADDVFSSWIAVAESAPAAIKAAGKTKRERRKASNSKVKRAVKAGLKGTKMRIKKLGLTSKSGVIRKNGVGIPLRRTWSGDLLVSRKGEEFCRLYDVGVAAQYKGGGRYDKPAWRGPGRIFKISACR